MKFEQTLQCMMDFYADLFPTRKHCLNHLFCTVGNGYEWENGELVNPDYDEFPTYQRAYIRAFGKMLDVIHAGGGKTKWKTAEDVFSWWMEEENVEGQISLFDMPEWQEKT